MKSDWERKEHREWNGEGTIQAVVTLVLIATLSVLLLTAC